MANKVEDLVNVILESYNECDITARIDEENMLNKDILIEIIDEIRKVLFPGFFDNNKVRSEYLKFLVGERLEFIQYHLKKQVSNAFANQDVCRECSKAQAEEKAEEVVFEFLKRIPEEERCVFHRMIEKAFENPVLGADGMIHLLCEGEQKMSVYTKVFYLREREGYRQYYCSLLDISRVI